MKKKFLSLMMAAAVVATTSVSAFAANDATVTRDGEEVNVTITGSVNDKDNRPPEGTISVTVPTALAFNVDNNGKLQGSSLTITNNGTEKVDVFAYEFIDKDSTNGIEIKKTLVEETDSRKKVTLSLSGTQGVAKFTSDRSKATKGIYNGAGAVETSADGVKLLTIGKAGDAENTGKLTLDGEAGKAAEEITKAIREEFTLRLKIKKSSS